MSETASTVAGQPARTAGYLPLRGYAAIGDGRTVALVAEDGAIDWLCLPNLDSAAVFAALLDAEAGGSFTLRPEGRFAVSRRYLPGSNVLCTTFTTDDGSVQVTDAMTVPADGLSPQRELVRVVRPVGGSVRMDWQVTPRFSFGAAPTRLGWRAGVPVATCGNDALAVRSWGAGDVHVAPDSIRGRFTAAVGNEAVFALSAAHQEPLVIPSRAHVVDRVERTEEMWRTWSARLRPGRRWTAAVVRSALALRLLVFAPSGAIAAAATTSLPETIGAGRNWDYRYCWVRDSALVLNALLRLGCAGEADAFFWWLMQASQLTHPRLRVLYRLDGGPHAAERTLPLSGYRGSEPARVGNAASGQLQLDVYGDLLHTAWLYARAGRAIDADIARRLAETTDLVCRIWSQPDSGLWEVRSASLHFTQSKMMCAIAVGRAIDLASAGQLPDRHVAAWQATLEEIREFIETRCWSADKGSYVRSAGSEELDASLLLAVILGYHSAGHPRLVGTVEAIRRELSHGPFVYRYSGEDGLDGREGAFLTCSFWLAEALALQGRAEEASALLDELVAVANDVGLYAEEVDPLTGEFLGNLPQALTHLSLINAALTIDPPETGR